MKSLLTQLLAAVAVTLGAAAAMAQPMEIEGVKLDPSVQVGTTTLHLNGAGVRTRALFKVYVAGLYVPQRAGDAATLLAQPGARRVTLVMLRHVDADSFASALNEGLRNNHTEAQWAGMKPQVDALNATLKTVGEARKGDVIHFELVPEQGTRVTVNGQVRGAAIPGDDFFTSVLRIWIGDKPVDGKLKMGLLSGAAGQKPL